MTPGAASRARRTLVQNESSVVNGQNSLTALGDFGADPRRSDHQGQAVVLRRRGPVLQPLQPPALGQRTSRRPLTARRWRRIENGINDRQTQIPGSERDFLVEAQSLQYMGKLTYLINQDHNVSVSVTGTPSVSGGNNGSLSIDPQSGGLPARINGKPNSYGITQELAGTTAVGLKYAGAFAEKKFLVDANVGWFHQTSSTLPVGRHPSG